jgi:hypothetical protein
MKPEDEKTATACYIAGSVSTQLMLKSLFELIAMTTDDPDGYARIPSLLCCRTGSSHSIIL